jgi:PAS domain S-box-containing protein
VNRVEHGFQVDDVVGREHGETVGPEDQHGIQHVFDRVRATKQPQAVEHYLDPPSGERRWYSNQCSWYETSDGSQGVISILTDVTRRKLAEMQVESLRHELVEASHRAGMAEIATGVLHNVGNVLNSVNVSTEALMRELESSRLHLLGRTVAMLDEQRDRLAEFLANDPKGRKLPTLLDRLRHELEVEQSRLHAELSRLRQHVGLMRSIVEAQQRLAKLGDMVEPIRPDELVRQTLTMFQLDFDSRVIELVLELDDVGAVVVDKQAALQVLANLIRNAIEALEVVDRRRMLTIRVHADDHEVHFDVQDNGCGIDPEHLDRLFQHGFSTKPNGHGFGLHASAIAARTMNGTLEVHSEGLHRGARVRLTLPRVVP